MVVIKVPKEKCCGCNACAVACPMHCIQMKADTEGFSFPMVDVDSCVDCGVCELVCPSLSAMQPGDRQHTEAYAVVNNNDEIRNCSSSGGVFSLIAEETIRKGGVVFGAAFTEDYRSVHHVCIDNINDLGVLRGSKYMQSEIGNSYEQAKQFLETGRGVLFSGTPCQICGLLAYLKGQYDNLITQDIVCHGVPSSLVWRNYIDEIEQAEKTKVKKVCFRDKETGWKQYSVRIGFSTRADYSRIFYDDQYMQAFLSDYCLRYSCYDCSFKTVERQSDITLADFWGIEEVVPEMDDNKGTSLVLVHSEKGKHLISQIAEKTRIRQVDIEAAVKGNPSIHRSAQRSVSREQFFEYLKRYTLADTMKKMNHISVWKRIKRKIRKFVSK